MEEDDRPPDTDVTRGYKHRLNQLFAPEDVKRIKDAAEYVHAVMGNVSLLIKFRIAKLSRDPSRDKTTAPMVLNETEVLNAVRAVQFLPPASKSKKRAASEAPSTAPRARVRKILTSTDISASDTVAEDTESSSLRRRQEIEDAKREERQAVNDAWLRDYVEMTSGCSEPVQLPGRGKDLSVSHVFGNAAKQYVAAVITNVRYHFRSYVCSSLGIVLKSKICVLEKVRRFQDLGSGRSRFWRAELGKAYEDVLGHRKGVDMKTTPELRRIVERHRVHLVPPLPPRTQSIDADLDNKSRPFVYLGYIVRMTAFMEASGARTKSLKSPVPLKTSFIPAHYTFDTSAITQLLMDNKRIHGFRRFFEHSVSGGYALPGLESKASLNASLEKQRGAEKGPVDARDEELYLDALWTYLAYFRNRRTRVLNPLYLCGSGKRDRGGLMFGHSISTDGYSVTLLVTDKETRGRKDVFRSGASRRTRKPKTAPQPGKDKDGFLKLSCSVEGAEHVKAKLRSLGCDDPEDCVGGDPGKGVILLLVDGKGNRLRYTAAQRRHETCSGKHADAVKRATRRVRCNGLSLPSRSEEDDDRYWRHMSAKKLENEMRSRRLTAKTCDPDRLRRYVSFREAARPAMEAAYGVTSFRALRFQAWCRRDASVRKFAEEIKGKFGSSRSQDFVEFEDGVVRPPVVIFYGDWGRRPNLKHQAPTPGIGLRRLLEATEGIVTVTVNESYTSSFCPNCEAPVSECRGQHGLLKCEHAPLCGTYWSRDVLGAMNIRAKGIHLWHHSVAHSLFGA